MPNISQEEFLKGGGITKVSPEQFFQGGGVNIEDGKGELQPEEPGIAKKVGLGVVNLLPNLAKGFLKEIGSTAFGVGTLLEKGAAKITGQKTLTETLTGEEELEKPELLQPKGVIQKVGYGAGIISEFLSPGTLSLKVGQAIVKTLPKVPRIAKTLGLAGRATTEAGIAGGIETARQGEINEDAKTAALVGAMFPVVGQVISKAKGFLKPIGEKIQHVAIRPSAKDTLDGFKLSNITKYDVGGTLEEMATKTHTKINSLMSQLKSKLKSSDAKVDVHDAYFATKKAFDSAKEKAFGDNQAIQRVMNNLLKEVQEVSPSGISDLVEATNIKRGAGTKGSWSFQNVGQKDATAVERVYTKFYDVIKKDIEKAAPTGLKEINKSISELIPISNAVLRRLPVEQRNNIISLTDSMGLYAAMFDPRALALIGASKLSKSGKFGQWLINVASKKPKTQTGQRVFGQTSEGKINMPLKQEIKNVGGLPAGLSVKATSPIPKDNGVILPTSLLKSSSKINVDKFEKATGLSNIDKTIEKKAFKRIIDSEDSLLKDYKNKHGKVVNTDNFRPFFAEDGYKGYNSASVQEPSSYLSKKAFTNELKNPEEFATFFSGGSGTGKTSAINGVSELEPLMKESAVILDSNLSSLSSAKNKIDEAIKAGKAPSFIYVYREPIDSFVNGVVARMKNNISEGGRIVPTKITAGNHIDSWKVINKLNEDGYAINFVDNSLGKGSQKLSTFDEMSAKIDYPSKKELTKTLDNKAKELYDNKTITKEQYENYIK